VGWPSRGRPPAGILEQDVPTRFETEEISFNLALEVPDCAAPSSAVQSLHRTQRGSFVVRKPTVFIGLFFEGPWDLIPRPGLHS